MLLVVALGLAALGFTAIVSVTTYLAFLAAAIVTGLGVGLYPTPARGLILELFAARADRRSVFTPLLGTSVASPRLRWPPS